MDATGLLASRSHPLQEWAPTPAPERSRRTRPALERRRIVSATATSVDGMRGTLIRSHITPEIIEVERRATMLTIHLTNLERAQDETHGFTIGKYNLHGSFEPGETATVKFTVADTAGRLPLLLHRVLLGPPSGDAGISAGQAEGLQGPGRRADGEGRCTPRPTTTSRCRPRTWRPRSVIDGVVGFITEPQLPGVPGRWSPSLEDADRSARVRAGEAKTQLRGRGRRRLSGTAPPSGRASGGSTRSRRPTSACVPRPILEQHGAKKVK